ncbi:MAG: 2-phospho-L-lactate transferase [Actinomycetota bacterium]
MKVCALAGGSGAAKFLGGLAAAMDPADITIIGNTGDDAVIHGLHVSPDLDIVMYTLAGLIDSSTGWGIEGDTTAALEQLRAYGVDAWFTLKDRDIGTHLARTTWMSQGLTLSEITNRLCRGLSMTSKLIPMSDQPVATKLIDQAGNRLDFQEYFVKLRHSVPIRSVEFEGAGEASPAPGVLKAVEEADLIVVCPSNPVISIGPILAVPGIREALAARKRSITAISPIVQGAALKGPAGKLLPLWGAAATAAGVASLYRDICGTFVLDRTDRVLAAEIEGFGMKALCLETVMRTPEIARNLAAGILRL